MAAMIGGWHPIIGRMTRLRPEALVTVVVALKLHEMGKSFAQWGMNRLFAPRSMTSKTTRRAWSTRLPANLRFYMLARRASYYPNHRTNHR